MKIVKGNAFDLRKSIVDLKIFFNVLYFEKLILNS